MYNSYKEFLSNSPRDYEHVMRAKKVLAVGTYQAAWNIAATTFVDCLKCDLPEHQRLNYARRSANLVFTKAMEN